MGAEATLLHPPRQSRTPSRLSNCGEMVSESVLEQLEMELRLESDAVLSESRIPSPGGRKLLVGMKLNATCREMLAWTILDLAKPGDHIIAFHVAAFPIHSGTRNSKPSLNCIFFASHDRFLGLNIFVSRPNVAENLALGNQTNFLLYKSFDYLNFGQS